MLIDKMYPLYLLITLKLNTEYSEISGELKKKCLSICHLEIEVIVSIRDSTKCTKINLIQTGVVVVESARWDFDR